jgi:hypothetical protein
MPDRNPDAREERGESLAELGRRIAEFRRDRGLSLEEAARGTRIRETFLRAMEEGRLEALPGRAYARGFLRTYLSYLGAEDLWALYDRLIPSELRPEGELIPEYAPPRPAFRRTSRLWLYLVLLVALVSAAYLVWQQRQEMRRVADRSAITQTAPTLPIPPASPPPISLALPSPPPASADRSAASVDLSWMNGAPAPSGAAPSPSVVPLPSGQLELRALRAVWVRVSQGGTTLFQGLIQSGDVKTFPVTQETRVRIGNAGALSVRLGESLQDPVGRRGRKTTLWCYPDGTIGPKRLAPTRTP